MARFRRVYPAGYAYHVVQQGQNRQPCFLEPRVRVTYLDHLLDAMLCNGVFLHAYVLMGNHVHCLLSPTCSEGIPRLFRRLAACHYGGYLARAVNTEAAVMNCYRDIDLAAVRMGLVSRPEAYYWSSYCFNALGAGSAMLTPHSLYLSLGGENKARQDAYREFCGREPGNPVLH